MHDGGVRRIDLVGSLPFLAIHVGCVVGVAFTGVTPALVGLAAASYAVRIWAVTVGYHRFFSHRSYKTSRVFQFLLGLVGTTAVQKGPLWWAEHHRLHHRHADTAEDIHSPARQGFFWAHVGWILSSRHNDMHPDRIDDLARYPELRWLDRHHLLAPLTAGALVWWLWGPAVFVWVGLVATVAQWHAIFTSNSLCHVIGRRRFDTPDDSRNNLFSAVILLGEGWHNNHHHYPGTARQGFYWWEFDPGYYSLKLLEKLGLVWDVRGVPPDVLASGRVELALHRA